MEQYKVLSMYNYLLNSSTTFNNIMNNCNNKYNQYLLQPNETIDNTNIRTLILFIISISKNIYYEYLYQYNKIDFKTLCEMVLKIDNVDYLDEYIIKVKQRQLANNFMLKLALFIISILIIIIVSFQYKNKTLDKIEFYC